jgi:uncharacterized protein
MKSYDYQQRTGVARISWNRFAQLTRTLTESLAGYNIEMVIGIARAGLFPATAVACALRCEFYPIRLTRRYKDQVQFDEPVWKVDLPPEIDGQAVAIVDEIADTGRTLALAAARARQRGASQVVTAALVSHTWAQPMPNVTGLVSDALIVFPWDEWVYQDGGWRVHPELAAALKLQGIEPADSEGDG